MNLAQFSLDFGMRWRVLTHVDPLAFGTRYLENGVVADQHGHQREAEGNDEQDDRIGQRRRPAEETAAIGGLVLVSII